MNLEFGKTTSFIKHWLLRNKRILISQGAGRSGKTFSILQLMILTAYWNPNANLKFSIVSNTLPRLRKGAIRDFQTIMIDTGLWDNKNWNRSESIYYWGNNIIEFFSADDPGKVRGPQRDFLFINECNSLSWETARQLMVRTSKQIYLDYNPEEEFWVHTELMPNPKYAGKWGFVKTTLFDNEELPQAQRDDMLAIAERDPWFKKVYIDGELGIREGAILPHFKLIPHIPEEIKSAGKEFIGLDFGWNDPTAISRVWMFGDRAQPITDIYIDEIYYAGETSTDMINEVLKPYHPTLIIADNARPDIIAELKHLGRNITGATSKDIIWGINLLKRANLYLTERSANFQNEFRKYTWAQDKWGNKLNVPVDDHNHLIDGLRYCALYLQKQAQDTVAHRRKPTKVVKI